MHFRISSTNFQIMVLSYVRFLLVKKVTLTCYRISFFYFSTVWFELLAGEYPFKSQPPEVTIWQVGKGIKQSLSSLQASRDVKVSDSLLTFYTDIFGIKYKPTCFTEFWVVTVYFCSCVIIDIIPKKSLIIRIVFFCSHSFLVCVVNRHVFLTGYSDDVLVILSWW